MNDLLYVTVGASLLLLAVALPVNGRRRSSDWTLLRQWLLLALVAMLVCSFFGGAVSDPQYRYQGRLVWLVPFFAAIAFCLWRRALAAEPRASDAEAPPAPAATVSAAAN